MAEIKGRLYCHGALDLTRNRLVFFFLEKKNTGETVRLIDVLRERYAGYKTLYLSWDSAPWHRSERVIGHLAAINETAHLGSGPRIVILPLPTSAQFLNVIESVFSGMARAVLHNSDYASVEEATAAVSGTENSSRIHGRRARRSGGRSRSTHPFERATTAKTRDGWVGQRSARRAGRKSAIEPLCCCQPCLRWDRNGRNNRSNPRQRFESLGSQTEVASQETSVWTPAQPSFSPAGGRFERAACVNYG